LVVVSFIFCDIIFSIGKLPVKGACEEKLRKEEEELKRF